jgi:Holliday junction resolvasome RuvABC endonuclease subunit
MRLIVIGLDPSFANLGICAGAFSSNAGTELPKCLDIEELKLIHTDVQNKKVVRKSSDDLRRAKEQHTALHNMLDKYSPHIVFTEVPSGSQSAVSAKGLGITIGILASITYAVIQVSQQEVKMASVGKKTASKEEMIDWATSLYPDAPWLTHNKKLVAANEHLADAVAVINAGMRTDEFQRLVMAFTVMQHPTHQFNKRRRVE